MTQATANSVRSLASPCFNAIKAIAGEECEPCEGTGNEGIFDGNGDRVGNAPCSSCNGTGKVKYVWKPEVGEWVLWNGLALLISDIGYKRHTVTVDKILVWKNEEEHWFYLAKIIPILPWETIERILEGVGYRLTMNTMRYGENQEEKCTISTTDKFPTQHYEAYGGSRQEAVMLAVIALAKEAKK